MARHAVKLWTVKRKRARDLPGSRREYHVECSCGWETMVLSRADRKVDVRKHHETAVWADRSLTARAS